MLQHSIIHRDGTPKTYNSPAYEDQYLYFTGSGDDIENGIVGGGENIIFQNTEGATSMYKEMQFLEDIQLKDGYIFWENANFSDYITVEIVLPANTPFESDTNTGNASVIDGVVTNITASPTPDETWTGTYFLFPIDVPMVRFVNKMHLFGTNVVGTVLESSGVALIKKIFKTRVTVFSPNANTSLRVFMMAEVFRETTV